MWSTSAHRPSVLPFHPPSGGRTLLHPPHMGHHRISPDTSGRRAATCSPVLVCRGGLRQSGPPPAAVKYWLPHPGGTFTHVRAFGFSIVQNAPHKIERKTHSCPSRHGGMASGNCGKLCRTILILGAIATCPDATTCASCGGEGNGGDASGFSC